jgi:UDP:flavonoid glycosyltransferase YjiC (YdhE family)
VKRTVPPSVLKALAGLGVEVRLQGLGLHPPLGGIRFVAHDETAFVDDLASCRAVVSTAGNQLVGEALHLGKPVLAFPEPGNAEQRINAHLLRTTGCGETAPAEAVDLPLLRGFLDRLDGYRARIVPGRADGTERALELLRAHLP